jgi:ubiquinone/menaquinone biosynthesis C-methylase UbiE
MLAVISHNFCVGVDISEEAITYANERYNHPQVAFISSDILKYTRDHRFTNIVSLETLEHVEDPEKVIEHLYQLLLPGGRMVVSAPVTPSVDANPFHVHDFTESGFRELFSRYGMMEVGSFIQKQPYSIKEVLSKKRNKTGHIRKGLISYYASHPKKFFLRMRSLFADGLNNKYLILVLEKPH